MKTVFVISLAVGMFLISCTSNTTNQSVSGKDPLQDSSSYTEITWADTLKTIGTVKRGDTITVVFPYTNTGNKPLVVLNVEAACGCTVPSFNKAPLAPGKSSEIIAKFNTANQYAEIRKYVKVTANTRGKTLHTLIFTGQVTD
jgi:hypothetical protein